MNPLSHLSLNLNPNPNPNLSINKITRTSTVRMAISKRLSINNSMRTNQRMSLKVSLRLHLNLRQSLCHMTNLMGSRQIMAILTIMKTNLRPNMKNMFHSRSHIDERKSLSLGQALPI